MCWEEIGGLYSINCRVSIEGLIGYPFVICININCPIPNCFRRASPSISRSGCSVVRLAKKSNGTPLDAVILNICIQVIAL